MDASAESSLDPSENGRGELQIAEAPFSVKKSKVKSISLTREC